MKKYSFIAMLAVVAMAAFSCAKEVEIVEETTTPKLHVKYEPVVVNAFADDDIAPDTKTSLNSLTVEWASTDQIAGYVDGNVVPQKSSATSVSGNKKRATFTFGGLTVADKAKLNYLFYPALSAGNEGTGSSASKYNINLLSTQKAVANSFADDANIAIAKWDSDEDAIQFKNMGAILGITVNNDNISSVKISANQYMTGHGLLDPTPGGDVFDADAISLTKDGNKYVILSGGLTKATTYYAVVYPGTYSGLTIEITRSTDGKVATFTNPSTLIVERNDNIFIANIPLLADDHVKWETSSTSFTKVESDLSADWSGDYLFVHEGRQYAYDGSKKGNALGANGDWVSVSITDKAITATDAMLASRFIIAPVTGGYSIKSASGYYIGRTENSNGINTSTTEEYVNTIAYDGGKITITSSAGPKLQFLNTSGSYTFKYYRTTQTLFSLFKLQSSGSCGVTYNDNGASSGAVPIDANSYDNQSIVSVKDQNTLVKDGYIFVGWNTKADGSGIAYNVGDKFIISEDVTLYAQWAHYTVTWLVGSTAFKTEFIKDGGKLSVPANNPDPDAYGYTGYTFIGWTSAISVNTDGTSITYAANNDDVTADITYHAVFAVESIVPGEPEAASLSTSFSDPDENWTVNDSSGTTYWKIFSGNYIYSPSFDLSTITKVTVKMGTYGSGTFSLNISSDSGTTWKNKSPTSNNENTSYDITSETLLSGDGYLVFTCTGATGSAGLRVKSITINYTRPTYDITYSDYTTSPTI